MDTFNKTFILKSFTAKHTHTHRLQLSHHVFHADADLSIVVKSSIEAHNIGRITLVQHLKLSDDLVSDCRFNFKMNELNRKNY